MTGFRFPFNPRHAMIGLLVVFLGLPGRGQTPTNTQTLAARCAAPGAASLPECRAVRTAMEQSRETNLSGDGGLVRTGSAPVSAPLPNPVETPASDQGITEFQKFTASSLGHVLPIFGSRLFENVPSTFAPLEQIPVTADYIIGPGDEILLRTWGQVQLNLSLTVDRNGLVFLPQAGNIRVAGLSYGELAGHFQTELGRVYRNFELSVNMGQLRSIQVIVVGQAKRPGTYTVSSLSTLVNVLFASGGPSNEGTMRRIQMKRGQGVAAELDMYDLLQKGDKSADVRLLHGDVIYIPTVGPQVALDGSAKTPAIYELKGESTAGELIELAGGLSAVADVQHAVLERIKDQTVRETTEFALNASGLRTTLRDGDMLRIQTVGPRFDNAVTLRGNVANPGRFPWHPGLRLRDIIPDKEALITRDYWKKRNSEGFVPLSDAIAADPGVEASRRREPIPVLNGGSDINWTYAQIERRDPGDLSSQFVPFNPGKLLLENDDAENVPLRSGDVITIFSQDDIRVSAAQKTRRVWLEGEFRTAGVYNAKPGETLAQLVARVGGLTPDAYLYASEFQRESTRLAQQKNLDQITTEMEREIERSAANRLPTTESGEAAIMAARLDGERRLVQQMRSLRVTGRIVLNRDPNNNDISSLAALQLEDGDRFIVPNRPQIVSVAGSVYNANTFLHDPSARVLDYLRQAGGATRTADKGKLFIIRADGSVVPKEGTVGFFSKAFEAAGLNPGDTLVVPETIPRIGFMVGLRDWTQVFSQLALGAAAINVLK